MKKSLLIVVALLCMASLMAAMAYTSAVVHNPTTVSIVNSAEAYLRIYPTFHTNNPEKGYKDLNVFIADDGRFTLDFTKGVHGVGKAGFQPGSKYVFEDLFHIYNESKDTVQCWLEVEGEGLDYMTVVAGNTVLIENGKSTGKKVSMGYSNGVWNVDVIFEIPENAKLQKNMNGYLVLYAEPK